MTCRGVFQLKRIHLQYCDFGGSSKGARDFLQSVQLKSFIEKNPQIEFKFMRRRGTHPYITATYINGYIKDQPLRNFEPNEIFDAFQRVRNSFGRKRLSHGGKKVYGTTASIQGGWKPNLWNNYPQFKFEYQHVIPEPVLQMEEKAIDREKMARQRFMKDEVNSLFKKKETLPE